MEAKNKAIRIIKREQRKTAETTTPATVSQPAANPTRELAATVTAWVSEFRQRRPVPARYAFAGLFK